MSRRIDSNITADVLAEISWDPAVSISDLDVRTSDGFVTLSGTTATYVSKHAAEDAAYRVRGVRGVTNDITIHPEHLGMRSDAEIEGDVVSALTLDMSVPADRITVAVDNDTVTLTGNLDYYDQRQAAEDDAGRIAGVMGVVNLITMGQPSILAENVADQIASALARTAELTDDNVNVLVNGGTVTLDGTVRSWSARDEAEDAARRTPGVGVVVNNVRVTP